MTVTRRKDTRTPRVLMHRVADIRGGVSVNVSELGGDYLKEGSVLSAPIDGIAHVIKIAEVAAESTGTSIKVKKGHNFKVGDFVMLDINSVAAKVSAIDESNAEYDTFTISATLGTLAIGGQLVEAKSATSTASAFKYTPLAITGTGLPFKAGINVDVDAWLIAVTKDNALPACVAKYLTGIINY